MKIKKLLFRSRWEIFFLLILVWKDIKVIGTVITMTKRRKLIRFGFDLDMMDS